VIVLDASVLIAHLDSTDLHHDRATRLLVETADERLAVSPLTLAEVLVGPARSNQLEKTRSILRELEVNTVALTEDGPERLATLRATTRLRLPDCCVLLAAETTQAAVATFDDRLIFAARELGHQVHG
jgi:predicted nucleic acid-binding protein